MRNRTVAGIAAGVALTLTAAGAVGATTHTKDVQGHGKNAKTAQRDRVVTVKEQSK